MDVRPTAFLSAALLAAVAAPSWGGPPAGAELRDATIAIGYESKNRCPDLIQADVQEPSAALVVLVVGPSGVPSQPSLKSSSGSESLDTAALSCVMQLRFLPAVRAGEGSAMASWQQIAWKWGRGHTSVATAAVPVAGTLGAPAAPGGAEVRVCADDGGKLTRDPAITRSSGDAALDEAALRIARAGAPYYRPAGASTVSGCAQLIIKFEAK
jgi:hypothetical protein